jgi:hypothetical protein
VVASVTPTLLKDIKTNGGRQTILLYQNQILDGRNCDRACIKAEIEPRYEQARVTNSDEALDLVVSLNDHRRHMTVTQRGFAAARLANLKHGSNQFRPLLSLIHGKIQLFSTFGSDHNSPGQYPHDIKIKKFTDLTRIYLLVE